jgi:hypothetical protein
MVLHTWTRELLYHPHVHCIVTDGGLTNDSRWVGGKGKGKFLFPVKALSVVFRAKFLEALTAARRDGKLSFGGSCANLVEDESYEQLCKRIASKSWNVYAKRPFKRPEHVFEYLGRYTHRVGISNHRLLSVDNQGVSFRTKGGDQVTVAPTEFMRRFLLHVLPKGFVKIRHYGLYASGNVNTKLERAREILAPGKPKIDPIEADLMQRILELTGLDLTRCPQCAALLVRIPIPKERSQRRTDLPDPAPAPI